MSVYRPSPGSRFWCDTTLPKPFDRVKLDTWSDVKREARRREGLVRRLYDSGQHAALRELVAGEITLAEVVSAERENKLTDDGLMANIRLRAPLWDTIEKFFPLSHKGRDQKARNAYAAKKLASLGFDRLGAKAVVGDLERVDWEEVYDAWPDSLADYGHVREMIGRFLTLYLGDVMHPARRAIMKRIPHANVPMRKSALSIERFQEIIEKVRHGDRAPYLTLLVTGMRSGEYLRCRAEHKRADLHAVDVPGTKTQKSKGLVAVPTDLWPVIEEGIPSPWRYKKLRLTWKDACRAAGYPDVRLHDIRHLTAHLLLAGGASVADAREHMRHESVLMTLGYAALEASRNAVDALASKVIPITQRRGA